MESEKTNKISQHVENDAILPSSDRTMSFKITSEVTQDGDHVADMNADDDEDQGQVMSDIQDFIAVEKTRRNSLKHSWITTDMIVACALPVIEEAILST